MEKRKIQVRQSNFDRQETEQKLLSIEGVNRELVVNAVSAVALANKLALSVSAWSPYETPEEKQKVIALGLLIRLVDATESILILAANGQRRDIESLFRVFLDTYFLVANVCSNPNFVVTYLQSDAVNRLKILNSAATQKDEMFDRLKEYGTAEMRTALAQEIENEKMLPFQSKRHADQVNCSHIYDSMYRIMSATLHTSPRCLQHYFGVGSNGHIEEIVRGDSLDTTHRIVDVSASFLLKILAAICDLFEFDVRAEIHSIEEALDRSLPEHQADVA